MNDPAAPSSTLENAKKPDTAIFALLHAAHVLEDKLEDALAQAGLSTAKYSVLNELVSSGSTLSLTELASRLSCVKSNMTQLVDRLEADGLVRRVDDPADRRAVRAAITDKGRAKQEAGAAEVARLHEEFAASVDPGDREAVQRMLAALG